LIEKPATEAVKALRQAPQGSLPLLGLTAPGIVFGISGPARFIPSKPFLARPKNHQHGRHRYHRLASAEVANLIESIAYFAARPNDRAPRVVRTGPRDAAMRLARTCCNHFAGRLGVDIVDAMQARGEIEFDHDGGTVAQPGRDFLRRFGVAVSPAAGAGRVLPSMLRLERAPPAPCRRARRGAGLPLL
jgi:hypothetical protein